LRGDGPGVRWPSRHALSPLGFAAATAGAFIILAFYKILAGYWLVEGENPVRTRIRTPYSAAAAIVTTCVDD